MNYASQLRGEILRKIAIGTFRYADYFPESRLALEERPRAQSFLMLSTAWLESADLAKSTREGYRKSLRRYAWPLIGDKPIDQVTELELLQVLAQVTGSKKTRNNTLIPIRRTFALARLTDNPAARVEYATHHNPEPDPFNPEEVDAILAGLLKRYGPQVENWFGLGFYAGPRTSELIAMRWSDIDWQSALWRVQRAHVRHENKGTKTGKARDHELNSRALAYLQAQRQFTQMRGELVFLDPVTGKPYNDDKPPRERYWRPTLKALGIRYRDPYHTRHTYITMAIMGGANPVYVARQCGNSPRVIFKHYARWIESADRSRERGKIEEALGAWGTKKEGK